MTRKLSSWNMFVKKVYEEGKAKDENYEFKQALVDASKRKSEMRHSSSSDKSVSSKKSTSSRKSVSSKKVGISKSKSRSASASMAGGKTRKRRRH